MAIFYGSSTTKITVFNCAGIMHITECPTVKVPISVGIDAIEESPSALRMSILEPLMLSKCQKGSHE